MIRECSVLAYFACLLVSFFRVLADPTRVLVFALACIAEKTRAFKTLPYAQTALSTRVIAYFTTLSSR